jgi:membrane-bound serine protease (ClpP class)
VKRLLTPIVLAAAGAALAGAALGARTETPGSATTTTSTGQTPKVLAIHFSSDVDPVSQDWLSSQLDRAVNDHYDAAVIVLDTPGGLEDSMRKIVQKELSLPIPVIVYVAPAGARAASAGVWIAQAADVLAMAPETNIGSSTPIDSSGQNIGSDLRRKAINDAAASLRGLAASHGRNAKWANSAVRVASNLTAAEALRMNVIDTIAPTLPRLLDKIDGWHVKAGTREFTLHTANATIDNSHPGFLTRLLSTLIDPNIISLLFLAGIAGIGFEIFHPGMVLPGALGAVAMVIALFGFSALPISWAGLMLVLLGVVLLVFDVHAHTHGALSVAGLIALAVGLTTLFHNAPAPYHTSTWLIAGITIVIGGLWAFFVTKAVAVRRAPPAVGPWEIVGMEGVVSSNGLVHVRGEFWEAHSAEPLREGQHVRVDGLDGLTLEVHRV